MLPDLVAVCPAVEPWAAWMLLEAVRQALLSKGLGVDVAYLEVSQSPSSSIQNGTDLGIKKSLAANKNPRRRQA